jgi:NADPH:quinone reductase-like Zn-dependent oxidoreductase
VASLAGKACPVSSMMALRAHARGGPEQLRYEQAPVPVPGPGEVLVAVHAAGITFAEFSWDLSWTTKDGADRTPVIPAHEMSGTVAAVPDGIGRLAAGDEVLGLIDFDRDGAAAQFVAVPAANLTVKPPALTHAEAATLPLAGLTAWQALVDYADLQPRDQVLVQGGSGAVGSFAVQLAALLGGEVTATGRGGNADLVRGLGAGHYCAPGDLTDQSRGQFDVVIDTVGGAVLDGSYELLRTGGRLVTLSAPPDQDKAASFKIHAMFFIVAPDPAALAGLAERASTKSLRPLISSEFPLAEGRQAYESGRQSRPPGKTILLVR